MGCYDTVMVPCPKCGEQTDFQTKSGDCTLRTFNLTEAPGDVMEDINRHSPYTCEKCATRYYVVAQYVSKVWPNDEEKEKG